MLRISNMYELCGIIYLIDISGGGIMKRKIYLISMIVLTFITTSTIMCFHPYVSGRLSEGKNNQLVSLISQMKEGDLDVTDGDIHIINDEVLGMFVKFYSDKGIEDLEIHQKEEIRYILESMGDYNTSKLKNFLNHDPSRKEGEIYRILSENLFDEQLMFLDEMLGD